MRVVPVQRLLTQQALAAGWRFALGAPALGGAVPVAPMMVFSPGWLMPLINRYAMALGVAMLGEASLAMWGHRREAVNGSPLGWESHVLPVDGSAEGILRAALVSRACEEALGARFDRPRVELPLTSVIDRALGDKDSFAYRVLHAEDDRDLVEVVQEGFLSDRPLDAAIAQMLSQEAETQPVSDVALGAMAR